MDDLSHILDKAAHHAADTKLDQAQLVAARLAPDMYPLGTQVQIACEMALSTMARLQGQTSPPFAAKELRLDELKAHITQTIAQLSQLAESAFETAETVETVEIKLPVPNQPVVIEFDGLHLPAQPGRGAGEGGLPAARGAIHSAGGVGAEWSATFWPCVGCGSAHGRGSVPFTEAVSNGWAAKATLAV